jgi:hypothetical protein
MSTRLTIIALLLAPLATLQAAGPAATPAPAQPGERATSLIDPTPSAYRAYFIRQLDALRAKHFRTDDAFLRGSADHIHVAALAAACELRAWQWTRDERYARSAVARLRLIAAKEDAPREVDFFTPFPLAFAWRAVTEGQLADPALTAALEKFVAQRIRPRDFTALNNQTLIRACGLELAAQVWPALPQARSWHAYALTIGALLEKIEDIPENAPTYNALDLVGTWLLADLLKQPGLTAKPGIAAMYRRYRDQVSPLGFIAPYGDSGAASRPPDPDWPMHSPWAHYVAAFERAAHEYRDPTLRWAALRLVQTGVRHMPLSDSYTDIEPLFYFSFAADWTETQLHPQPPAAGAQVLTRRDEHSTNALDKLILAPSRQPGVPFALVDLYSRGAHGHVNQHGAVTYFEFRDTPLLTALGYNNREPAQANLVFLAPADAPFPHIPGGFVPGVWQEASLPTGRLPVCDERQPFLRRIDKLNFRITAGRRGVDFSAANLRLGGGDQPALTLDALREAKGWRGHPTPGPEGLVWRVARGVQFLEKAGFGQTFDCRAYPRLLVRWQLSNNDEQARPIILRVHAGTRSLDYHVQATQLDPTLVSAQAAERDGVHYGTLRYTGWFTADTTLCRHMALLPTGVLIVRDTLLPGPAARGLVAGPLWHMAATNVPAAGPNWFNSAGGKSELLTWFAPAPARTFGTQAVKIWSKDNQQTVFARQALQPGRAVTFISVLIPHDRGTDAAALAQQISLGTPPDDSICIKQGREELRIDFNNGSGQP